MATVNWSSAIAAHLNLDAETTTKRGVLLAEIGGGVQSLVEQTIGRTFELKDYVEVYSGTGRDFISLRHDPVVSVSRLLVMGSEVTVGDPAAPVYPPADVVIESPFIRFTNGRVFPVGFANVQVEYRAGYRVPPPDLIRACVMWAALIFKNRDRIGLSSQSLGGQSTSFTDDPPAFVTRVIAAHTRWGDSSC